MKPLQRPEPLITACSDIAEQAAARPSYAPDLDKRWVRMRRGALGDEPAACWRSGSAALTSRP
jgi:hypothetical protein